MPLSVRTASLLLFSISFTLCQAGRRQTSGSLYSPRTKTVELLSRFPGCPNADQSTQECPIPRLRRCVSSEQCGKDRVCCPAVHPTVVPGCGYCTKKIGCDCPKRKIPVCGTDGNTYLNQCWLECAGVQWDCPGTCPCSGLKEGVCPPPSQNRTKLECPSELGCWRDSDCDLEEKCCPDYHSHRKKSCGHSCQPPFVNPSQFCIRTKPWWLGTVQGTVSLARFYTAKSVESDHRNVAYFINACIELLEMGAIAFDYFVLKSGYLNTMLGDNSLLEAIEVFWMCRKLYQLAEDGDVEGCIPIMLGLISTGIYLMRVTLIIVTLITFALGALWYGILAGPVFLASLVLLCLFRGVKLRTFFHVCFPGTPLAVLVVVSFLVLEVAGIAGWNHVLRQPRQSHVLAGGTQLVEKCNSARALFNSRRCNFTFVKRADYWEGLKYVYECGSLVHWVRDARDGIVMAIGIL